MKNEIAKRYQLVSVYLQNQTEENWNRLVKEIAPEAEKYNGWTNYATWRVNLELIDGTQFVREDITSSDNKEALIVSDVMYFFKDNVAESLFEDENDTPHTIIYSYARAFLDEVNWAEIARHFVENNPEIVAAQP